MTSASDFLTKLHSLLVDHFDLNELRTLCFDLSVDYDALLLKLLSGEIRVKQAEKALGTI
jgi:Effector-associated domain 7